MADRKSQPSSETETGKASLPLVLFLHGHGGTAPTTAWVDALQETGCQLFSHQELEGAEKTEASFNELGALCLELQARAPGLGVVLLRHPLEPSAAALQSLADLLSKAPGPVAYTTFSNAEPDCNPWAGLRTEGQNSAQRERLISFLGSGRLLSLEHWPAHLLAFSPESLEALGDKKLDWKAAPARLRERRVTAELADWIYVEAPGEAVSRERSLRPHEEPYPRAWGNLSARLAAWTDTLATRHDTPVQEPILGERPVTLHITHSWGGGVATWVQSMIEADREGLHLQLRSEAPENGQGAGQRLGLYLGNELGSAIDQWWLQPAISSVAPINGQYREVLDQICERFGIGRVIVSSLVGHSLDALRTERPTIQVLHDAFPAWPLLGIHPGEFDYDLGEALKDPRATEPFGTLVQEDWDRLQAQYAEAIQDVELISPSRASAGVLDRLISSLDAGRIHIIPHGLPALPSRKAPAGHGAGEPGDDRLRIVVPGRVQTGKGAELLDAILGPLTEKVHVTLLGTGKGGERFFGRSGVNVILNYERESLPELLDALRPDIALLPSVVPETFSYTLSEMWALGLPVLATRVGSFEERIEHGENGWLADPRPETLLEQLHALIEDSAGVRHARETVRGSKPVSMNEMISAYGAVCPGKLIAPARPVSFGAELDLAESQARANADLLRRANNALEAGEARQQELKQLIAERTRWAEQEKRQRKEWVTSLKNELAEAREERDELLTSAKLLQDSIDSLGAQLRGQVEEIEERNEHIKVLDLRIEQLIREHEDQLQSIYSSHSWRLTRPLRGGRRLARQFFHLKAWNPLRWPLLASQMVRNLSTVGLSGTLHRMQQFESTGAPLPDAEEITTVETPMEIVLPAAVPSSDAPRVSIIIPAFNHLEHTAACLLSIAECDDQTPVQVIVIDDESSDETQERLQNLPGLEFIRNEENQGFIRSCNRGLEASRGDFVLFLNNDTQVEDHWLERLLETFDIAPDAGLVGSRLVYPDGTLQECGGMVFNDGSGWNYGRGDDPNKPEYQFLREVDYCSGACIMLPRPLLEELGGFDEHYVPAYYEDTDLAFKVRAAGYRVYVQPRVSITHFEGVSSGTDLGSGTKRYQVVNREKFLARWTDALKAQPSPIQNPDDAASVRRARDHRLHGRVLLVDAYTPEPDQDSGSVRLVNLMSCLLEMGYGVTFFADNRGWNGRYTEALQQMGVEASYDPWLKSADHFLRERGKDFSHVIISRHYIASQYVSALRKLAPDARFIFDTVDLHYLREERLADLEDSAALRQVARQTRRSELSMIRSADATLVVSPVEQTLLAKETPDAGVFVLSNIHELGADSAGFKERSDIYFVGGYQHPPNVDAAIWFVNDIWPTIREALPDLRFHLVGSKAPEEVRALGSVPGVKFHGFVESVEPFLEGCRISVAPLRYGAGVKGKVNQAMAHGQPVVASPAAVEGIHAVDGEDALVAEDANAFAEAVIKLYGDEVLWERLSANGRANVEAHFSKAAAKRDIQTLFDGLEN